MEAHPPVCNSSETTTDIVVPSEVMTRAITPTVQVNSNVTTEDNQFDKKKNNDVTVNGISLMEIMRAKKTTTLLKTTKRKMTSRNKNKRDNTEEKSQKDQVVTDSWPSKPLLT